MAIKKIKPNEPFDMGGTIYEYSIAPDGNIALKRLKTASNASKKEFESPTLADVKQFFASKGYSEEGAIKAWEHYEYGNPPWTDTHGTPVRAWKQKMNTNWLRPEYKLNESPRGGGMVM